MNKVPLAIQLKFMEDYDGDENIDKFVAFTKSYLGWICVVHSWRYMRGQMRRHALSLTDCTWIPGDRKPGRWLSDWV
ncbi:hypothetical protein N7513_009402 [Penicillium frequentans]|nr:hypothetical protein N7513_009402 [Penicillium glabrum]